MQANSLYANKNNFFRKGAVVGLTLKPCLLATEEKDDQEGTPGKAQCCREFVGC